jgi:cell division protein FtsQ
MFKKRLWVPILIGLGWLISLSGLVVLMSFIERKKGEVVCKGVKIYIPGNQYFIDNEEVNSIIKSNSDGLVGRRMSAINLHDIEKKLQKNAFIAYARVYTDMDDTIRISIGQRQPILRMVNRFDQDFYIDQQGIKIPLSENFTARVLVANGFIDEAFSKVDTLHTEMGRQLFITADFIRKDSLWDAQIAQLYVNANHEIELIPRVGKQRILLGDADSLAIKFSNLYAFYKQALPQVGWDRYKLINLKYTNQVIGVKSDDFKSDSAKAVKPDSSKQIKGTLIIKK